LFSAAAKERAMSTGAEPVAGRAFETPTELGARNWWQIATRIFRDLGKDHLSLIAAGCAFYAMLAIVPSLTALILVYGLVFDPASVREQLDALSGLVPDGVQTMLQDQLTRIAATSDRRLGWSLVLALALALWPASAGVRALIEAMNIAYNEEEKRNLLLYYATGLGFTLLAVLAMTLALFVILGVPALLAFVGLGSIADQIMRLARWPLLAALVVLGLGFLYRYGPSRHNAKLKWVSIGAVVATLIWIVASAGFSLYIANFANYNETYGSLGAVIVVLFWLYISAFVVILGAKLNGELEHETSVDTTVGAPKPPGQRGAYVADHVPEGPIADVSTES
jgi:membrane protein